MDTMNFHPTPVDEGSTAERTLESLTDECEDDTKADFLFRIRVEHLLQAKGLGACSIHTIQDLTGFYIMESHEGRRDAT